ncbi:hypothetical protein [Rubrimonas cliftonensis]|uniref:Uncharacterized protein n=1 Tax=Rubrimonas cliftonensis TaxID=89524 RepID=A0A1H3WNB9_9RHOB|nr:hypothetical protein [Rubrimonas cliftonensis]SDZ88440.1 hypothetical protein SAMN05444370_10234 [Rubrimonas cliftonensis]
MTPAALAAVARDGLNLVTLIVKVSMASALSHARPVALGLAVGRDRAAVLRHAAPGASVFRLRVWKVRRHGARWLPRLAGRLITAILRTARRDRLALYV